MILSRRSATAPYAMQYTQRCSMPEPSASEVTQLLLAWSAGDQSAREKPAPLGRQEPHRLAKVYMSRERPGHTLQTTAPVNEDYLRLVNVKSIQACRLWTEYPSREEDESGRDKPRQ
jgi:hypothetical protein